MAKTERIRERTAALDLAYLKQKLAEGWRLIAVEWEREVEGEPLPVESFEDVPYGLRVAGDCSRLEENPTEREILTLMLELIVQDNPLSKVADELNRRGFRTRQGTRWGPISVFNMLPRLIEVGPRIFSTSDWAERRRHLFNVH